MATQKTTKPPEEAVNSAQLEQQQALPTGPTPGELEERTADAEVRAEAAERENAELKHTLAKMERRMAAIEAAGGKKGRKELVDDDLDGEPVFDESAPHGTVIGDPEIAYVQNGYQFGRDKSFVSRDPNRGVPRPFNPRLIGQVKPRAGAAAFDPLDGIRDN